MHEDILVVVVDVVPLLLGDVVGHVVNHIHAHALGGVPEDVLEGFPDPVGDHLSVCPGVVGTAAHGLVVIVTEFGVEGCACKLPVRQVHRVLLDVALHLLEVIGGDLVSASARTAVDGDRYGSLLQSEDLGGRLIEDILHKVQLQEVVA